MMKDYLTYSLSMVKGTAPLIGQASDPAVATLLVSIDLRPRTSRKNNNKIFEIAINTKA
jgi:hypothetical protein